MAKILEETLKIKLSKLIKNTESTTSLINEEFSTNLEAIVQELVGDSIIVEVEKDKK